MGELRPAARRYLLAIGLAGLAAAAVPLARVATPAPHLLALAIALTGAATAAALFPLSFGARIKLCFDTAILTAAVCLFEPGVAVLVPTVGMLLAHVLRRHPWDQTLFNGAQTALVAAAGGGFLVAMGWRFDRLSLDGPRPFFLMVGVGVGMLALSTLVVTVMMALQEGEPPARVLARTVLEGDRAQWLAELAQVGLGVLVVGVAEAHSWMVALLLLPAGALYQALAHRLRLHRAAEARLIHYAYHDRLTDLPNRALLLDRLEQALARADRRSEAVGLLFVDLDRFKVVNDRHGHAAGDRLLAAVGERLRDCARPGDTVARLGGDEFVLLLDGVGDAAEATAVAARATAALERPFPLGEGGGNGAVSASVGVAVARPGVATPEELLRDADVAMYRAKERGKACYVVFEPEMGTEARERRALDADLRRAIADDQLRLAFQPIVDLATGRVVAAEALVRWDHPGRGPMLPNAFIPLAEETGLVGPLDRWVLGAACRQGRAWADALPVPPALSVNVSARQFGEAGFVDVVADVLRRTGLAPRLLTLEITETAMMADAEAAVATLRHLKGLGVRIALDDFGTGYSSLGYLQRFPLDALKVDRRFVAGLGRDRGDETIVGAVVGLAHALGLAVVGEGVETREQAERLGDLGCELGQGYYFGRPVPAAEAEALLVGVTYALRHRA